MQMNLFDDNEIMNESELKKKKAREYTAKMIYRSSGEREKINTPLQNNNVNDAFKAFEHAFKTFGFSDNNYSFLSPISPKGTIKIRNDELEFEVTSKELFDTLLPLIYY